MTDDAAVQQLVARLARPRAAGGHTVERAALLAAGADFDAIEAWIIGRGGQPEAAVAASSAASGLHGQRSSASVHQGQDRPPVRYQLPVGAFA